MRRHGRLLMLSMLGLLHACGGGGSSTAMTAIPRSKPIVAGPSIATRNVELGVQPTRAAIPVIEQITGTLAFPAVTSPATIALTASSAAPPGVALNRVRRAQTGTLAVLEYLSIVPQTTVNLPSTPAMTFTFPGWTQIAGKSVFYGISNIDAQGALVGYETHGPGTISGQSVAFPVVATPLLLLAGHRYTFVVYGTGTIGAPDIFTEYAVPTPFSRPAGIAAGRDGALWFVETKTSFESIVAKIGRVTTAGVFTEYSYSHSDSFGYSPTRDSSITAGPDGAVWFTQSARGIARISTGGVVSEYAAPGANGITSGPDGALWFTQSAYSKVGRITTSGNLSEFPIPNGPATGITTGADGALWFTEPGKIGRITIGGKVTEYAASPFGDIAAGPDGALWFPLREGGKIARITTDGHITSFGSSRPGVVVTAITAGPGGAMWFTTNAQAVGRITMAGTRTEYQFGTPDAWLGGIAAGSDGALWFTDIAGNNIGRIAPP